jgi:hypothetical protein
MKPAHLGSIFQNPVRRMPAAPCPFRVTTDKTQRSMKQIGLYVDCYGDAHWSGPDAAKTEWREPDDMVVASPAPAVVQSRRSACETALARSSRVAFAIGGKSPKFFAPLVLKSLFHQCRLLACAPTHAFDVARGSDFQRAHLHFRTLPNQTVRRMCATLCTTSSFTFSSRKSQRARNAGERPSCANARNGNSATPSDLALCVVGFPISQDGPVILR